MDLTLSSEQEQLIGSIIQCLDGEIPVARLHQAEAAREAAEVERMRTLGELGWYRVSLPEAEGGAGLGFAEEALLSRELGRRLAPASALTAVIAGRLASMTDLAQAIQSGERIVALAVPEPPAQVGRDGARPVRLFASCPTDLALLVYPQESILVRLPATPPRRPCLDRTLWMASADLCGADVLARAEGPRIWMQGLLLLAAMLSGHAEAARDMIVGYAKVRQTFGRLIGSYQAVRHPIAEMAARCEQAKCLVLYAALSLDENRPDAAARIAAARALAQTAAARNDDANIQLHGGIGVTDDLDAHLFMKRAIVCANWFGGPKSQLKSLLNAPLLEV